MTSFAEYIGHHARVTDNPRRDFIIDARDEIERGRFATGDSESSILWHLQMRRAYFEAVVAARLVHRQYRRWLRSRGEAL